MNKADKKSWVYDEMRHDLKTMHTFSVFQLKVMSMEHIGPEPGPEPGWWLPWSGAAGWCFIMEGCCSWCIAVGVAVGWGSGYTWYYRWYYRELLYTGIIQEYKNKVWRDS